MIGFDTTKLPKLDINNPDGFTQILDRLKRFFADNKDKLLPVTLAAQNYSQKMEQVSSFIEAYTQKTCPYCGTVCCAQKHGLPEFGDVAAFLSLGHTPPYYDLHLPLSGACQFMGPRGCTIERIIRPYRCTWYFCDPLLTQIEIGPTAHYNQFIKLVQQLADARGQMLTLFYEIWTANLTIMDER